jgi:hypothetical protein
MEYLGASLNFTIPTGSCASAASCPAGTYSVAGYQITMSDSYRVGGILNYPSVLDVVISHQQPSIFARMVGYSTVTTSASARATPTGPQTSGAAYAVAAVSGDAMINGGGAAFQTVGGPIYAYGSFGANNGPHSTGVPSTQTNPDGSDCAGKPPNRLDNGGGANSLNYHTTDGNPLNNNLGVPPPTNYDNASPVVAQPAPTYFSAAAAKDGAGNWKPGIYNGFAPSGGTMNGGVYKIINSPGPRIDHKHHSHPVGHCRPERSGGDRARFVGHRRARHQPGGAERTRRPEPAGQRRRSRPAGNA